MIILRNCGSIFLRIAGIAEEVALGNMRISFDNSGRKESGIYSSIKNMVGSLQDKARVIEQIDQVTQANTASAEESAAASEELASQSQQLKAMIEEFQLEGQDLRSVSASAFQQSGQDDPDSLMISSKEVHLNLVDPKNLEQPNDSSFH